MIIARTRKERHVKRPAAVMLLTLALILFTAGSANAGPDARPFDKGSVRLSLLAGSGTAFDQDYTIIGIGGGYYAADGLEAGLDAEAWEGSSPRIYRISPGLRYVLYTVETIKPYGGVFYRRTFIENERDENDAGVRAGGIVQAGQRAYFGVGIVYDAHLNCDRNVYSSCEDIYPELMFEIVF